MMKVSTHPYGRDVASLIANSACMHTIWIIFARDPGTYPGIRNWLLWLPCILVTYLLAQLMLRRDSFSSMLPLLVGLAEFSFLFSVYRVGNRPDSFLVWLVLMLFNGILLYRLIDLLQKAAPPEARLLDFELSCLVLIVALLMNAGHVISLMDLLPCLLGTLCSLVGLAWEKSGSRNPTLSMQALLYTILLPGAFLLCAILLFLPLTTGIGHGLQELLYLLLQAATRFMHQLARFFPMVFHPASRPGTVCTAGRHVGARHQRGGSRQCTSQCGDRDGAHPSLASRYRPHRPIFHASSLEEKSGTQGSSPNNYNSRTASGEALLALASDNT